VHFTMAGYTRMWQKAAAAVQFSTTVASAEAGQADTKEKDQPTRRSKRRNHHHARKRHGTRHSSSTEPDRTEAAPQ
jgi:hypothetical protein